MNNTLEQLILLISEKWGGKIILEDEQCDTWFDIGDERHTIVSIDTERVYLEDFEISLKNLTFEQREHLFNIFG